MNVAAKRQEEKDKANSLAFGLAAELSVLAHDIERASEMKRVVADIVRKFGPRADKELLRLQAPRWRTAIYDANINSLGVLGPSIAGDIYLVYSKFTGINPAARSEPVEYETFLRLTDSTIQEYLGDMQDITHVHKRLMTFASGKPDPGPLWATEKARKKREAQFGKENADKLIDFYSRGLESEMGPTSNKMV
ncbi:hypothetical protein GCM10007890_43380 [Methylobacterium tardum]|uniref:Uncharacterized protein n=1 Tax=Methylobacterium tardum TaxID=374432 RepID=A0AA37WSW3_9HYPH|nr:hypothetical protein GCM10007890_43380 [Methylobacterium tardum]